MVVLKELPSLALMLLMLLDIWGGTYGTLFKAVRLDIGSAVTTQTTELISLIQCVSQCQISSSCKFVQYESRERRCLDLEVPFPTPNDYGSLVYGRLEYIKGR